MSDGHPYGKIDVLRIWMTAQLNIRYVMNAVPYTSVVPVKKRLTNRPFLWYDT